MGRGVKKSMVYLGGLEENWVSFSLFWGPGFDFRENLLDFSGHKFDFRARLLDFSELGFDFRERLPLL